MQTSTSDYLNRAAARGLQADPKIAHELRARKIFFPALAAFRSNILDSADLSTACRDDLLALLRIVDANAPTSASWDRNIDGIHTGKEIAQPGALR